MNKLFLTIIVIPAMLVSCSSKDAERSQIYLLHDIWALDSLAGEKVKMDENIKNLPVLEIYVEEERVHGNTGCNTLDGTLNIDENEIEFLNLVTTEMACSSNIEQEFLTALQKVNRYKIEKLRLFLYEDNKEIMCLRKID